MLAVNTGGLGGGALYLRGGNALVANNLFVQNRATSGNPSRSADGGAMMAFDGVPRIINNVFRYNQAVHFERPGQARGGAILVLGGSSPQIVNNTFLQNGTKTLGGTNTTEDGGALSFHGPQLDSPTNTIVVNNLLAYNSSGISVQGRVPVIHRNLVWENLRGDYESIADQTGTNGNLRLPPGLTGPYGDPHLTSDSPARDAGDNTAVEDGWLDMDGGQRVVGEAPDIGADEYDGTNHHILDRVIHVTASGFDGNDGTAWSSAKRTIGAALATAALGGGEVWVQSGAYCQVAGIDYSGTGIAVFWGRAN